MIRVIPKMDLVLKNVIYILWYISSPPEKDLDERSRAHGPSCLLI